MSGYVDHAWRHRPKALGGTDPIEVEAGSVDLALPYYGAFQGTDQIDFEDDTGPMRGHIDTDYPTPPFSPEGRYSGISLLQRGLSGDQGQLIIGNASGLVIDASVMATATADFLLVNPTWSPDPVGIGPYLPPGTLVGQGVIRQWSADDVNPPHFEFGCYVDFSVGGIAMLSLRMFSDGSVVKAGNPIDFAVDDEVNAFWSTFTWSWD